MAIKTWVKKLRKSGLAKQTRRKTNTKPRRKKEMGVTKQQKRLSALPKFSLYLLADKRNWMIGLSYNQKCCRINAPGEQSGVFIYRYYKSVTTSVTFQSECDWRVTTTLVGSLKKNPLAVKLLENRLYMREKEKEGSTKGKGGLCKKLQITTLPPKHPRSGVTFHFSMNLISFILNSLEWKFSEGREFFWDTFNSIFLFTKLPLKVITFN